MQAMTIAAMVERDEQHEMLRARVCERSMVPLEGEKRLMLAVVERAVDDFRIYVLVPTGRGRRIFREAAAWFDSSACGPFDFEGICQATGLDPDFIRKGLVAGTAHSELAEPRTLAPIGDQVADRWQRGPDARIADSAVRERDVEVDSDEDSLSGEVDVAHRLPVHPRRSFSATYVTRSATRRE
jgi:hypothetical protein